MSTGFGLGASLTLLLTFLIKFFFVLFIVGLIVGLIVAAKNYVFTPDDIKSFKATFKSNKNKSTESEHLI
ncbi:MAG: hypothetical protein AB2421_06485 [Thermotaleaceae bacterium]